MGKMVFRDFDDFPRIEELEVLGVHGNLERRSLVAAFGSFINSVKVVIEANGGIVSHLPVQKPHGGDQRSPLLYFCISAVTTNWTTSSMGRNMLVVSDGS